MNSLLALILPVLGTALIWGFAPRALLRLLVRCWPAHDDRRRELIAEYEAVARKERVIWVLEVAEAAIFEGLPRKTGLVAFDALDLVASLVDSVFGSDFSADTEFAAAARRRWRAFALRDDLTSAIDQGLRFRAPDLRSAKCDALSPTGRRWIVAFDFTDESRRHHFLTTVSTTASGRWRLVGFQCRRRNDIGDWHSHDPSILGNWSGSLRSVPFTIDHAIDQRIDTGPGRDLRDGRILTS